MFDKRVKKEGVPAHLAAFAEVLKTVAPFDAPSIEAALAAYCTQVGEQTGTMIHALRLATTGQQAGPGVYDCLALLGRDKCVARISVAVAKAT